MQYPALGRYNTLSAITNPTLKKKFEEGRNGRTKNTKHIVINLREDKKRIIHNFTIKLS